MATTDSHSNSSNNTSAASGSSSRSRRFNFYERGYRVKTPSKRLFRHNGVPIESFRQGYPRLAAFVNSDQSFCVFKNFGRLHARVLLDMQDELMQLSDELDGLDNSERTAYVLQARRKDRNNQRRDLLQRAGEKLGQYNQLLEGYYRHIERHKPTKDHLESIANWLDGNKPLVELESKFLDDWHDLSTPNLPTDHAGIETFLEAAAVKLSKTRLRSIFSAAHDREKSTDRRVSIFTTERVNIISRMLSTFLAVVTLTVPIAVLYNIREMGYRLLAIAFFTAIFSAALCMTQLRNFEMFSATAAYCAVMVVFVANLPQ